MIEWGLCCIFREEPIRFRRATAASLRPLPRPEQLRKLAALIRSNAENLKKAFECCAELKIGAFRINSELLMLATHAEAGYRLEELPEAGALRSLFDEAKRCADQLGLRRSLHPDQFVVLNSPEPRVRANSRAELEHQFLLSELCGATEINLHAGGVYGDKSAALDRLRREINALLDPVRRKLTLENDDRSYTPSDLLPLCRNWKSPSPTTSTTTGSTPTILRSKRRPGRRRRRGTVERFRPMSTSPALNCRGESPATTGPTPTGSIRPTSRSAGAE